MYLPLFLAIFLGILSPWARAEGERDWSENASPSLKVGPITEHEGGVAPSELGILKTLIAPIATVQSFDRIRRQKDLGEAALTAVEENSAALAGYGAIVWAGNKVRKTYLIVNESDFIRKSDALLRSEPGRVLHINANSSRSALRWVAEKDFNRRYGGAKGTAQFVTVESLDQLVQVLSELAPGSVDRLEISAHGGPGLLEIGHEKLALENLKKLSGLEFAAPNAEIRLIACQVAGSGNTGAVGEEFMRQLGSTLLNGGEGKVVATPKIIVGMGRAMEMGANLLSGRAMMELTFNLAALSELPLKLSRSDVVEVAIKPKTDCTKRFAGLRDH